MFGQRKHITVLVAAVAIFVLVIIALAAAPLIIPTGSYRQALIRGIESRTGASATVGRISVRLLPTPTFTVHDIGIFSPEEQFKQHPLVRIRNASGSFSPLSILKRRLDTKLAITGYEINYLSTAGGSSNFDRLFVSLTMPAAVPADEAWRISIGALSASHGTLSVRTVGAEGGQSIALEQLELAELAFGSSSLSANAYVKAALFGAAEANAELGGTASYDRASSTLYLRNGKLALFNTTATLEASLALQQHPVEFDVHAATPSITAPELAAIFPVVQRGFPAGIAWSGSLALDMHLTGTHEQTAIDLQAEASRSNVTVGSLFVKPLGRLLKISFSGTNTPSHLDIGKLDLRLGNNLVTIAGSMLHDADHQAQFSIAAKSFNFDEIKPSFPWLAVFGEATNPSATLTVQGSLDNPENRIVFGELTADSLSTMGVSMSGAKIGVHHGRATTIEFPSISATLFGGALSASGSIDLAGDPRYELRAVIEGADVATIELLEGALEGTGTLVINATTVGADSASLASAMKASGSLVMSRATFPTLDIAKELFTQSTWTTIERSAEGVSIASGAAESLADTTAAAEDLRASFSLEEGQLKLADLRYRNPRYTFWLSGSISRDKTIGCSGSLWLGKDETAALIANAGQRKDLVNTSGNLQIPFELKGRGKGLMLRLQTGELASMLKDRRFSPTPAIQ